MDNKELDKSRAEFEAEIRKLDVPADALDRWPDGRYVQESIEDYWTGFKIALARAGIAAPTGQQAEPVYLVWDALEGGWDLTDRAGYDAAKDDGRRILYTAPVTAAPAAPTVESLIVALRNAALDLLEFKGDASAKLEIAGEPPLYVLVGHAEGIAKLMPGAAPTAAQKEGTSEQDAKDAARYRYLRATTKAIRNDEGTERIECTPDIFDASVDAGMSKIAAMSAAQTQPKDTTDTTKGQA